MYWMSSQDGNRSVEVVQALLYVFNPSVEFTGCTGKFLINLRLLD